MVPIHFFCHGLIILLPRMLLGKAGGSAQHCHTFVVENVKLGLHKAPRYLRTRILPDSLRFAYFSFRFWEPKFPLHHDSGGKNLLFSQTLPQSGA